MKIGYFLTARLGSTRLPRKHLLEVKGQTLLEVLTGRIARAFAEELSSDKANLVIVTSDEPENREFERFTRSGTQVFYGSKRNIPLRHLQAAQALKLDAVVAVDGDDVLCSIAAMQAVCDGLSRGEEYATSSGLPLGLNVFGYRVRFLQRSLRGNEQNTLETGWGHIFDATKLVNHPINLGLQFPTDLRFTLDYPEDYAFFRAIIEHFSERIFLASDREIVNYVLTQRLYKITSPIVEKYWQDFRSVRDYETARTVVGDNGI